ncbi:MAG: hypothetical protein ABI442_05910 [Gemmatimonadaceae bacterium]
MDQSIFKTALAFVSVIVGMGCFTGIVTSWFKWRRKPLAGMGPEIGARLDQIAERLARLENAVDSTALEVERISEGQRFTTKLLAERSLAGPRSAVEKTPN